MNKLWKFAFAALAGCSAGCSVAAAEVRMIFGLTLPPYVIQGSASGYELDIIRAALAVKGHTLKPIFAAFSRMPAMLSAHQADAAQRGSPELVDGNRWFYADAPTVVHQNAAISLKKSHLKIDSIAELKGMHIVGYRHAHQSLGTEFARTVDGNPDYRESSDERRKLRMFYANETQVYVGDIHVFKYYRSLVKGDVDTTQPLVFHKIFPRSADRARNAVFLDQQIRDDFSEGLRQIKASGQYRQIIREYLGN